MTEEEIHDAELVEDGTPDAIFEPAMAGPFTIVQAMAFGLVMLLLSSTILYTVMSSDGGELEEAADTIASDDPTIFVTDSSGMPVNEASQWRNQCVHVIMARVGQMSLTSPKPRLLATLTDGLTQ